MRQTSSSRHRGLAWIGRALIVVTSVACTAAQPSSVSPSVAASAPPATSSPSAPPVSPSPSTSPAAIELAMASVPRSAASSADAERAAAAINAFAFDLHRAMSESGGNVVFSPASIAIALGMARTGAIGETASEMDAVLGSVASEDHANWLNALDQALAQRSGTFKDDEGTTHEVILDIANSYFAQRGLGFEPAFLDALATRFGAGIQLVDFMQDPEAARILINEWAKELTRGRIPEVLKPPDVTSDTRLALVNAIYLKAPWFRPFQLEGTTTETFRRPDGSVVQVPMMHAGTGTSCAVGPDWGAFQLPYIGGKMAMLVIVPDDLATFEASLDPATIDGIIGAMDSTFAGPVVALPRFKVETREELVPILANLGMPRALDPALADFSGMTTEESLFIGKVIHQANISVDEKGTEAAAVTVVGMDTTGGPATTCEVAADRPFLFAVRDIETGAILFLGRVVDPTSTP
jgi:serpin B